MHAYVRLLEKLLDTGAVGVRREKMYKLDDHVACAVAGITGVLKPCILHCWVSAAAGHAGTSVCNGSMASETAPEESHMLIRGREGGGRPIPL